MKKFKQLLSSLVVLVLSAGFLNAQNADNPWLISVGAHGTDHTSVRGLFDGFVDVDDFSIVPPVSKLSIARHLGGNFAVDLTASVGQIDNKRLGINDELMVNAGLGIRYNFFNSSVINPYIRIGANYHRFDYSNVSISPVTQQPVSPGTGGVDNFLAQNVDGEQNNFGAQGGVGINFWLTKKFAFNIATDYNWLPESSTDYFDFFQHTAGVSFRFGGNNDRDGDGIKNDEDDCPDTPGVPSTVEGCNGCPDSDGDGLCDAKDECPEEAGPISNNGCPEEEEVVKVSDRDKDGIIDDEDDCPDTFGVKSSTPGCNGCPDSDGDLICDSLDPCPNDPKNECEGFTIIDQIENVLFEYNKSEITAESKTILDKAAKALNGKFMQDSYWLLQGHTDSKGSATYNKTLSQKRADAVKAYLASKGVAGSRVKAEGLGEEIPVRPNDTDEGRAQNRRVEFTPTDANFKPRALTVNDEKAAEVMNKLARKVYFQTGSDQLLEASKINLTIISEYLKKSGKNWEVGGHTDNVGAEANNQKLSERRAQSVVNFLVSLGVSPSKLTAKGYGESQPRADNTTKAGRADNRRIEFK